MKYIFYIFRKIGPFIPMAFAYTVYQIVIALWNLDFSANSSYKKFYDDKYVAGVFHMIFYLVLIGLSLSGTKIGLPQEIMWISPVFLVLLVGSIVEVGFEGDGWTKQDNEEDEEDEDDDFSNLPPYTII